MRMNKRQGPALVLIMAILFQLSACMIPGDNANIYRNHYPECYTLAAHTLPGLNLGEAATILPLDTDIFGRTMFAVVGPASVVPAYENEILGIFVHYGVNDEQVYYREDGECIIHEIPSDTPCTVETVYTYCTKDELEDLKTVHGWNLPFSEEATARKVTRTIVDPFKYTSKDGEYRALYDRYSPYFDLLDIDSAGQGIYFLREFLRTENDIYTFNRGYFLLVSSDGEAKQLEEVKNLLSYREQLIAFKAANGWEPIIAIVPSA